MKWTQANGSPRGRTQVSASGGQTTRESSHPGNLAGLRLPLRPKASLGWRRVLGIGAGLLLIGGLRSAAVAAGTQPDYAVVVSSATLADPDWRLVVDTLRERHAARLLTYDGALTEATVLPGLQILFPRYACFVARPEEASREYVATVQRLTRRFDDDPYADCFWGILTGYDAANALKIARESAPLTVRKVAGGTEVALEMCEEGQWFCELKQHRWVKKEKGSTAEELAGPADTTEALVGTLNDYRADLFVTSGHATERDWQIGYAYRNGSFRHEDGRLYGLATDGRRFPVDSPNPKVYLPIGNCLMGHIDRPDCMATSWMNSAGVRQMIGYTVPTWYGYAGWGMLDYFVEQPGTYTFAEAFLATQHALIHRMERFFPDLVDAEIPPGGRPTGRIGVGAAAEAAGLRAQDGYGLLFDRDVVAFYGDPAWGARMTEGPRAFDQELREADGTFTFTIRPRRGAESFATINANGVQRGGRPFIAFLPHRVRDATLVLGEDLHPVITDDFILVPRPATCDPGRDYRVVFTAERADDFAARVERTWKAGETLPAAMATQFPIPPLEVPEDTGLNVLVDLAHQCAFATLWGLPSRLQPLGFRPCVSHASLDTVLVPGRLSRMRVPVGKAPDGKPLRPFGWVPNPAFNVVITFQSNPQAQAYLPEERTAVRTFVEEGGGLIVIDQGLSRPTPDRLGRWAEQSILTSFGVDFAALPGEARAGWEAAGWEVVVSDAADLPRIVRRPYGRGRIAWVAAVDEFNWERDTPREILETRRRQLDEVVRWTAAGRAPVGGEARLPQTYGGGGGIYPELEERLPGVVVYYARNQKEELLAAVRRELPRISDQLYAWLPSPLPEEPMFILVAAGSGGGWAVNAFYPKETGTISLDVTSLLGIFGHELGHTMSGPRNARGEIAASWFDGNQGEAHAGWWQGKVLSLYSDNKSMRDCNELFRFDPDAAEIDLGLPGREAYEKWGNGKVWKKLWWIWQKLDDRYGTTWYPRWRWVQYTRWQDDPNRQLTVDEMVEDMSLACGEDLFPFFRRIGTTLRRERLERLEFQGRAIQLPVAPITPTPAGNARHDPIGDYTQPLSPVAAD